MDRTMQSFRGPSVLDFAGRMIEKYNVMDSSASTLFDLIGFNSQIGATASGLTDCDYPNLSDIAKGYANLSQLKTVNKVPLPPEVMEHFGHMQCHCMMGLFPEINRAWLTIDSDIYVWTYEHGSDVAYFDGLGETIISVGLIKPKPDVFHNFIKYLLILTTTVEIVVLGVTFSCNTENAPLGPQEEMHLIPEPVFVVPTDGVSITTIVGSKLGRIFLGGRDGSLYEIAYRAEGSWFGKRFKKINHSTSSLSFLIPSVLSLSFGEEDPISKISIDNTRHILYTLSEKGTIEVFDLGASGTSMARVAKAHQSTIVQNALNIVKTLDSPNFRPIVSISALEPCDSSQLHLVAVSQSGVRFYFTTENIINQSNQNQRPSRLQLLHVRLPPGFSANAPTLRPKTVHLACYRKNSLLMITSPAPEQDHLWCMSSDPFPFFPYLTEAYTVMALDGPAWAMEEVLLGETILPSLEKDKESLSNSDPPLVVRQHIEPPRKFVVLTAQGAHIINKLRPVDLLRQLLIDGNGPDSQAVRAYFQVQKEEQACATCLILACLESVQSSQIADWATRAFFMYGGDPKIYNSVQPTVTQYPGFNPNRVSTPISIRHQSTGMYSMQQSLQTSPQQTMFQNVDSGAQMSFSPKHNGLYLYVGRILRPLWNMCCVQKLTDDSKKEFLISTITSEDCFVILSYLCSLRNFLEKNTQLSCNGTMNPSYSRRPMNDSLDITINQTTMRQHTVTIQDIQIEERQSLDSLKLFVSHACEILALWKILCEHQFHIIADALSKEHQTMLLGATFKDLIINGHEMLAFLMVSLINSYLNDNASVDTISAKLREVCPNLYKNEDAACTKANQIIVAAKNKQNIHEKEELLRSALQLCKNVAPNLNLAVICQQFAANQFYHGIMDLCITCAKKLDPKDSGLHYYKNNEPADDQEGYNIYIRRMECYKEVINMLEQLYSEAQQSNTSQLNISIPNSPGPIFNKSREQVFVTPSEASKLAHQLLCDALSSDDELLHKAVYDWMLGKQMHTELITLAEPSLETYLIKATQHCPDPIPVFDLLWKFYEKNGNHSAAAKVLNALASESGNSVSLAQRIEYLAKSVICMRSGTVGYAAPLGVFLQELEDRIQIARIQQIILEAIINTRSGNPRAEEAIEMLNSKLMDITELYEQYAEPFGLWECKLAIIHCSGHEDLNLIQTIWKNIILSELKTCHGSPEDKMHQLLNKVSQLQKDYGDAENCFPLLFILRQLEINCYKLGASTSLIPEALISMGIPMSSLISTYQPLVNEQASGKFSDDFHLFKSVAHLIQKFTQRPEHVPLSERLVVITKAQDIISSALSALYSKPNTEELISSLRSIQASLNRL